VDLSISIVLDSPFKLFFFYMIIFVSYRLIHGILTVVWVVRTVTVLMHLLVNHVMSRLDSVYVNQVQLAGSVIGVRLDSGTIMIMAVKVSSLDHLFKA